MRRLLIAGLLVQGCRDDAVVDLAIVSAEGRTIDAADVTVCDARDRSRVLGRLTIADGQSAALSLAADGSAVGIGVFAEPDLCGASCQKTLDSGAVVEGEIRLSSCQPCAQGSASADAVCEDPLCFVDESNLSICEP